MRAWSLALAALLAGCAASGGWSKPGADQRATTGAYQDCQAVAATAVDTQANIDQDILVSRGNDLQRSGVVRGGTRVMHERTRHRSAAIVASCMKAKGFSQGPAPAVQPRSSSTSPPTAPAIQQ
ncbi:MAG TPA: hypothetical protein VNF04_08775 [Stellaceae bacterium]|nr:hypothetical protein [Stellaceae bacterium]